MSKFFIPLPLNSHLIFREVPLHRTQTLYMARATSSFSVPHTGEGGGRGNTKSATRFDALGKQKSTTFKTSVEIISGALRQQVAVQQSLKLGCIQSVYSSSRLHNPLKDYKHISTFTSCFQSRNKKHWRGNIVCGYVFCINTVHCIQSQIYRYLTYFLPGINMGPKILNLFGSIWFLSGRYVVNISNPGWFNLIVAENMKVKGKFTQKMKKSGEQF